MYNEKKIKKIIHFIKKYSEEVEKWCAYEELTSFLGIGTYRDLKRKEEQIESLREFLDIEEQNKKYRINGIKKRERKIKKIEKAEISSLQHILYKEKKGLSEVNFGKVFNSFLFKKTYRRAQEINSLSVTFYYGGLGHDGGLCNDCFFWAKNNQDNFLKMLRYSRVSNISFTKEEISFAIELIRRRYEGWVKKFIALFEKDGYFVHRTVYQGYRDGKLTTLNDEEIKFYKEKATKNAIKIAKKQKQESFFFILNNLMKNEYNISHVRKMLEIVFTKDVDEKFLRSMKEEEVEITWINNRFYEKLVESAEKYVERHEGVNVCVENVKFILELLIKFDKKTDKKDIMDLRSFIREEIEEEKKTGEKNIK